MENSWFQKLLGYLTNPMIIGGFFAVDVIIIRIYIFPKYLSYLEKDSRLIESFIEWFGVAYGLFIALVLVNVWQQFDNTEKEFDREADAIFILYQSVRQITPTQKKIKNLKAKVIKLIKAYVTHVNQEYKIEHQKIDVRDAGDEILEKIRDGISKVIHSREKEAITAELIKEFNDAFDVRGDRISASKQRIPTPVWGISLASSLLWLIPFLGLNFNNSLIGIVLVGGVTIIVIAILAIIRDLDDPFDGTWKIDTTEWELLGEKIGLKPTLIFVFKLNSSYSSRWLAWLNKLFSNRLCALHSLLGTSKPQKELFAVLDQLAYLQIYYKDDFEKFYEKRYSLPVVIKKSDNKLTEIIGQPELSNLTELQTLIRKIKQHV